MFDLDADGFVSLEETVELFYRRYGRAVLFKKEGVSGMKKEDSTKESMLSFLNFVKHDIAFYPISRQMKDRRLYCKDQKANGAAKAARAQGSVLGEDKSSARWSEDVITELPGRLWLESMPEDGAGGGMTSDMAAGRREPVAAGQRRNSMAVPPKPASGGRGRKNSVASKRRDSRATENTLEKFSKFQEELKGRHRGHLVTRNSAKSRPDEVEFVQVPPARITPQQGLQKQRDLRIRRGSDLIYTFHGLNKVGQGD
jgi:hypothetical protein